MSREPCYPATAPPICVDEVWKGNLGKRCFTRASVCAVPGPPPPPPVHSLAPSGLQVCGPEPCRELRSVEELHVQSQVRAECCTVNAHSALTTGVRRVVLADFNRCVTTRWHCQAETKSFTTRHLRQTGFRGGFLPRWQNPRLPSHSSEMEPGQAVGPSDPAGGGCCSRCPQPLDQ